MRTIYADVFFFINMFVDFSLLLCVKRIIHSDKTLKRLIPAAISGAVLSFTVFLPFNHFPINLILSLFVLSIVSLIAFGYKSRKVYLKNTIILFILSVLFSGAMIFFYTAFKPEGMVIINNAVYFNISPALLILLSLIIYFLLFIFNKVFRNHSGSKLIHNVRIYYSNIEYNIKCKVDSGCNVKEPFSGESVIIIDNECIDINDKTKFRLIPFNSLGGSGMLKGYKAEKVYIDNTLVNQGVYIGLCDGIFKSEIRGLIPVSLIED